MRLLLHKSMFLLLLALLPLGMVQAKLITVPFYSERIQIGYDEGILLNTDLGYNEKSMIAFYQKMQSVPFQSLLENLLKVKKRLKLNDWFYYELLDKTVTSLFKSKSELHRSLACWFLLTQSGFDTRLTYVPNKVFVYVYSVDGVFEVPMIEESGRDYVNLTSIHLGGPNFTEAVYLLNFSPNPKGQSFRFNLEGLPKLAPKLIPKQVRFSKGDKSYLLNLDLDLTVLELMKQYPIIDEQKYFEVPMSPTLTRSLLPKLKKIIAGKDQREALEILVSFTRSAFQYKEDQDFFGKSKPMIPDELFHYPYSDCEDRSALFYCLVRELMDLPMIIIAYPDHLTIAVATDSPIGKPIHFQGRQYYICDPTGPHNSTQIGEAPREYAKSAYEILGFYN